MEEKRYINRKQKCLKDGNLEQLAASCRNLAKLYNKRGDYSLAAIEYNEEATCYEKLGKDLEKAIALRMVGEMNMLLSQFDKAKVSIEMYLKLVQMLKNRVEEQRAYVTLGRAYLLHAQSFEEEGVSVASVNLRTAEKMFLKSLALAQNLQSGVSKIELMDMQARCYLNLGVVKENLGDLTTAQSYIEKAIKISSSNDIYELTHLCYISMSLLFHAKTNDVMSALRYCNMALQVAKLLPEKMEKICHTLTIKAEILIKASDFASAKQILIKAYKKQTPQINDRINIEKSLRIVVVVCQTLDTLITTSIEDYKSRKALYERLGDCCCLLQNFPKAIEFYEETLKCAKKLDESGKVLAPIYVSLYQTYKDDKQYQKALEYLWAEYEVWSAQSNNDVEAFDTLCNIAEIYEIQNQNFWTIKDIYDKAIILADKLKLVDKGKAQRIAYVRLFKLHDKHMKVLVDDVKKEAVSKGIDIASISDESDLEGDESDGPENSMPEVVAKVCLEDLVDSCESEDENEQRKDRYQRVQRGHRSYNMKRNTKGETCLHQACIAGNFELARHLLDQGHVVNVRDHAGWLPLHEACNHGFLDIVELLLERGGSNYINDKGGTNCDGITPLYDACANGFIEVATLLLERGADATLRTDFGETCLDGLDNWRGKVVLNDAEQAEYEKLRAQIMKILSKVGVKSLNANESPIVKNTAKNTLISDDEPASDDDDDNTLCMPEISWDQSSFRKNATPVKRSKKEHITEDYIKVMDQLKRGHRHSSSHDRNMSVRRHSIKRPALSVANDSDNDSWLVNDLIHDKKKVRYKSPTKELVLKQRPQNTNDYAISPKLTQRTLYQPDIVEVSYTPTTTPISRKLNRSNSSAKLIENAELSQSRSSLNNENIIIENLHVSPKKAVIVSGMVSLKVKVEKEMLLISVERKKLDEYNIKWLAKEAARRYYNLVGLHTRLRLKTEDGFTFEEEDALSVALEHNLILGSVMDLQMAPASERYKEICQELGNDILNEIVISLERTEISNHLKLTEKWYTSQLVPMFKSLQHQMNLRVLELSYNILDNNTCEKLGQILPTLRCLNSIKLRGNFLTKEGLNLLLFNSTNNDELLHIEELDLSENYLKDDGMQILANYCQTPTARAHLRKLSISQCGIRHLPSAICEVHWTNLDISFNELTIEAVRLLMENLNDHSLQQLNLSYVFVARQRSACANVLAEQFSIHNFTKLRHLSLNGLELNDAHFYKIMTGLDHTNGTNILESLQISSNSSINYKCLDLMADRFKYLRKLTAINCNIFSANESIEIFKKWSGSTDFLQCLKITLTKDVNLIKELEQIWQNHWGEKKGKMKQIDKMLYLYINEEDVNEFSSFLN